MTPKMRSLLRFIKMEIETKGVAPSYDEMREHMGLMSKSGIFRIIGSLEERGYIKVLRHRARGISIIDEQKKQAGDLLSEASDMLVRARNIPPAQIRDWQNRAREWWARE